MMIIFGLFIFQPEYEALDLWLIHPKFVILFVIVAYSPPVCHFPALDFIAQTRTHSVDLVLQIFVPNSTSQKDLQFFVQNFSIC